MKQIIKNISNKLFRRKRSTIEPHIVETWTNSADYWERRYNTGGNSGIGSYGRLAVFKAEVLNQFVRENNINSVIEWGCGDGHQLSLANYPNYIGFDVSLEAIKICNKKFSEDKLKRFVFCGNTDFYTEEKAELSISLDVIYHLIEDDVYENYMKRLFASSFKYVCIYSCNDDDNSNLAIHVRHRIFTDWIENNIGHKWKLKSFVKNKYPFDPDEPESSWSDFYFDEAL